MSRFHSFVSQVRGCEICAQRFAMTATAHQPRPVVWLSPSAPILIAGQAPGARVHASGRPFTDRSGDRLRAWMGVTDEDFYDLSKFAILPMAFCFPGYDAKGSDLPPPAICAKTWHADALRHMPARRLTLLVGGYAHNWHLGRQSSVTQTVQSWRELPSHIIPLPHPSWRNTGWIRKNPWFEAELLPALRQRVQNCLRSGPPV